MENIDYVSGFLFNCPFVIESDGCVFMHIRKIEITERVDFINSLTSNELESLLSQHDICYRKREFLRK